MTRGPRILLFTFFVISGFSGLLYQIVWVRMALAAFGVITPFASVVVSVYMLGLGLGTWLGGLLARPLSRRFGLSALLLYGGTELVIGFGGLVVPDLFGAGRALLLPVGAMDSNAYLILSAAVITLAMLPWCLCMGATFPLMMAFIEEITSESSDSFSFLYLANVIGAMLGAMATSVVLIELIGFHASLRVAASLNASIAVACLAWSLYRRAAPSGERPRPARLRGQGAVQAGDSLREPEAEERALAPGALPRVSSLLARSILFLTGFTSMALEIVWMRAFTPVLGTLVYAFSGLLTVYLFSTWLGSFLYRRQRARGSVRSVPALLMAATVGVLVPALLAIPRNLARVNRALYDLVDALAGTQPVGVSVPVTLLSIAPFCIILGYLTPMLVDAFGRGDPARAGRAYAINIAGSIAGPLVAAYLLLPTLGSRWSMLVLTLPCLLLFVLLLAGSVGSLGARRRIVAALALAFCGVAFVDAGIYGRSFEEGSHLQRPVVRRDHTATVISYGKGFDSHLLVNGYGMTVLTTLTKVMAHLPLASLDHEPKRALVIAFGMGTTFRSVLSWGIEATAVELVPSVVDAFGYYFADAAAVRANPRGRIVIDDGRRFLARSDERFDVITVDPPPPVEAAGSSLLYAEEFMALVKQRLTPGGILHHWFPGGEDVEPAILHAVLRSARDSFPHVRIYKSLTGHGLHILCSTHPIEVPTATEFVAKLPPAARRDLREWLPQDISTERFLATRVLNQERSLAELAGPPGGLAITDDRPVNEYFALRRWGLVDPDSRP